MMKIISAEKIGEDLYTIIASDGVETCQSACKLEMAGVSGGSTVKTMKFDSAEFERLIMAGEIMVKDISRAIGLAL